jgi:hypothetical protein
LLGVVPPQILAMRNTAASLPTADVYGEISI